jgi:hypothetical protein
MYFSFCQEKKKQAKDSLHDASTLLYCMQMQHIKLKPNRIHESRAWVRPAAC